MRTNKTSKANSLRTYEGAPAVAEKGIHALRRAVSSCLLFEDEFYEDGKKISQRIQEIAKTLPVSDVASLAIEVRTEMNLRHVSLWLVLSVLERRMGASFDTASLVEKVCQRADEPAELLAMYWKDGRKPLPSALKRGLARAVLKFDAYQLDKWDRKTGVKLKDVVRLSHPKAANDDKSEILGKLLKGELDSADTWEVGLSSGKNKREVFERLLCEGKLGYLALLRNLRNMSESGVPSALVKEAILARKGAKNVLPFRYVAAARAAPMFEPALDKALLASIAESPRLEGETLVLVDVSGSMDDKLSKSDITRMDAAATLASMINGDVRVFTFSEKVVEVPARLGMAGIDAIKKSQSHMGTRLGSAVREMNAIKHDRLIVITDEQSADMVPDPVASKAYMINVASYENGVGYGKWIKISGFSEKVLTWIAQTEKER